MLIVNADDLGRNQVATDNILECHARRRLSSTSAMVFMQDSVRAAARALESGIDVGFHLNFSESFTSGTVPAALRDAHERIRRFLRRSKYALLLPHPLLRGAFRSVYEAQYEEFMRLYGRAPTHLDGHQHMHLATNVLLQELLPAGTKVRRSFSFQAGEKSVVNRFYRSVVDRRLAKRHRLTDFFFALPPNQTSDRLQRLVDLAVNANVELMTHPELAAERSFLLGDAYGAAMAHTRLAGHAEW